jgi:hypothetical protein
MKVTRHVPTRAFVPARRDDKLVSWNFWRAWVQVRSGRQRRFFERPRAHGECAPRRTRSPRGSVSGSPSSSKLVIDRARRRMKMTKREPQCPLVQVVDCERAWLHADLDSRRLVFSSGHHSQRSDIVGLTAIPSAGFGRHAKTNDSGEQCLGVFGEEPTALDVFQPSTCFGVVARLAQGDL